MVIFGIATITQLLSIFGLFADINMLVWFWGVGVGGGLAGFTYSILQYLALNELTKAQAAALVIG